MVVMAEVGRKTDEDVSGMFSLPVSSNGSVGTGSGGSVTVGETDAVSSIGKQIHPSPPTLSSKQLFGGSQPLVITLAVPERFEWERENLCKMFGVVCAVDTLRDSETRTDMAEGEFLGVTSPLVSNK